MDVRLKALAYGLVAFVVLFVAFAVVNSRVPPGTFEPVLIFFVTVLVSVCVAILVYFGNPGSRGPRL